MEISVDQLKRKYREQWIPEKYLENYNSLSNPWELGLISSLHDAVNKGKIKGSRGIDIGCGPTVHRMAVLGRVCDDILPCDYTMSNIEFVNKFLDGDDLEALGETLETVARLEGHSNTSEGVQIIRDRLRSKVKHVAQCDLTSDESVSNLLQHGGEFDCAISNGCLESACLTYDSFVAVLKRILGILKPGAVFALSGYLLGNFYVVHDVNLECLRLDVEMVKNGLSEAGFTVDNITTFEVDCTKVSVYTNCSKGFFSLSFKP